MSISLGHKIANDQLATFYRKTLPDIFSKTESQDADSRRKKELELEVRQWLDGERARPEASQEVTVAAAKAIGEKAVAGVLQIVNDKV